MVENTRDNLKLLNAPISQVKKKEEKSTATDEQDRKNPCCPTNGPNCDVHPLYRE